MLSEMIYYLFFVSIKDDLKVYHELLYPVKTATEIFCGQLYHFRSLDSTVSALLPV